MYLFKCRYSGGAYGYAIFKNFAPGKHRKCSIVSKYKDKRETLGLKYLLRITSRQTSPNQRPSVYCHFRDFRPEISRILTRILIFFFEFS